MEAAVKTINACRACKSKDLVPILSLGKLFISDFVDKPADEKLKIPLELVLCDSGKGGCGLLQLKHTTPGELMYRQYWYKSGYSVLISRDLADIVAKSEKLISLRDGDIVVDIGCNDGTLLRAYKNRRLALVGFEPAANLIPEAQVGNTKIFNNYFNQEDFHREFVNKKARIITAISMFYDLDEPNKFLGDIVSMLDKNGLFVIQQNYLASMIKQNAFDNILHEHLEYYSLYALENVLGRHGLEVFDAELNDINGGSIRTYVRLKGANIGTPDGLKRVQSVRDEEKRAGLQQLKTYQDFAARVNKIKEQLVSFINEERKKGKKIYIYGASTRGNTTLQFFGINSQLVIAATDKNPEKWGKKTVGSMIPIVSIEQYRKDRPDYLLVLPWHLFDEIMKQEADFLNGGGKFIVPMPKFRVVSK